MNYLDAVASRAMVKIRSNTRATCNITFLCISSALNFSSFSLSASPIAVFDDVCLFGVGFLGLNDPEAFLGNCELVCFLVSLD